VDLKYYYYISDAKLEMLYEQIEVTQRRSISTSLRVSFAMAELSLAGSSAREASRTAKLLIVCKYLDEAGIGTVDRPAPLYRGDMLMKWGRFASVADKAANPELVYFTGITENRLLIVLGGSAHHLLGEGQLKAASRAANSGIDHLMAALAIASIGDRVDGGEFRDYPDAWPAEAQQVYREFDRPLERLEFIAYRLTGKKARGDDGVLLGTPLYVAAPLGLPSHRKPWYRRRA
jgi:hypothetical protein